MKNLIKTIKSAKAGYTLLELIVVIAILIAVVGTSVGSISLAFKSRSRAASQKIEAMLSQSKVNSVSGRKNVFVLEKNSDNTGYKIELYGALTDSNWEYTGICDDPYESRDLDGRKLEITTNMPDNPEKIELSFNTSNGKLDYIKIGDEYERSKDLIITVSYGKTYEIKVYNLTGAIEMKAK